MCRLIVLLNSVDKVKRFVGVTTDFESDVFLKSGRYVVNGKSILGIFSVDLSKALELTFDTENGCDDETIAKYMKQLKEFVV